MRCLRKERSNSEEGTNSSSSLPHHQGLSAVQADDGDNLFLRRRPLGGILIIPTAAWILKASASATPWRHCMQGNLQVDVVRVDSRALDVNDAIYASHF